MLHCLALVGTDISEELIVSITKVTGIGKLGTMLTVSKIKACCKELCSHRGGYQHF
jgi:hypothetical protein